MSQTKTIKSRVSVNAVVVSYSDGDAVIIIDEKAYKLVPA